MTRRSHSLALRAAPAVVASALVLAACGGGGNAQVAQTLDPPPARAVPPAAIATSGPPATRPGSSRTGEPTAAAVAVAAPASSADKHSAPKLAPRAPIGHRGAQPAISAHDRSADQEIYDAKGGATDVGVTKDQIKLGSINMHGMALGNLVTEPVVRGNTAATAAINDRGGILGRRLTITDCDDGPGEVSRAKACFKKLVGQDQIFSLITGVDWATASIHDDLAQGKVPYLGTWAYSQTEWQDPYMFPAHMSMIHEAMAGANWVKSVIRPKTYGLICLTSPEMQVACAQVQKILDAAGEKMVKKIDVSISETSMAAQVLALRGANPDHIIHYVINPATVVKIIVEATQQGYYPPLGISGNHMAAEVLGSLFGQLPVNRYWTNTTYKLWGAEFISTMTKYARGNRGVNHHVVQVGYTAMNIFAAAAKDVGPNLTRQRLMAELGNGQAWSSDSSLDQKFTYTRAERGGDYGDQTWNSQQAQGREFMYKYTSTNTASSPDGSSSGWTPDPHQFVITTK